MARYGYTARDASKQESSPNKISEQEVDPPEIDASVKNGGAAEAEKNAADFKLLTEDEAENAGTCCCLYFGLLFTQIYKTPEKAAPVKTEKAYFCLNNAVRSAVLRPPTILAWT